LAPIEIQIDTRIPRASLRWISIGRAFVLYDEDKWWLKMHIGFFHKQWDLEKLIFDRRKKIKKAKTVRKKKKPPRARKLRKFLNLLKTFRVTRWQLAIDSGDEVRNAWLYPLNFFPQTWRHLYVNFMDENYLIITIRNALWKLTYAFLK
jgi:hypothetical protein